MTEYVKGEYVQQGLLLRPDAPEMPDQLLLRILSSKRAHGSVGDTNFRMWLTAELKTLGTEPEILTKGEGTITVSVGKSKTLFSCHIDTVHSVQESDGSHQKLSYDSAMGHIFLGKPSEGPVSSCLGADDGAGIYLMLKMIQAKVPGTYIFHTGEERGGIGCRATLQNYRDMLKKFSRAIAFDRPNDFEVITHQGGFRCASDEAGDFIVDSFKKAGLAYSLSGRGVFTDTKVYAGVIPECFNLGVAYYQQHSADEYLDVVHLEELLKACIATDWEKMPVVRKAEEPTFFKPKSPFPKNFVKSEPVFPNGGAGSPAKPSKVAFTAFEVLDEFDMYKEDEIRLLCEEDPEIAYRVMMLMYGRLKAAETERDVYLSILELN